MRLHADGTHKLSCDEHDEIYAAYWVSEVTEDTMKLVNKIQFIC